MNGFQMNKKKNSKLSLYKKLSYKNKSKDLSTGLTGMLFTNTNLYDIPSNYLQFQNSKKNQVDENKYNTRQFTQGNNNKNISFPLMNSSNQNINININNKFKEGAQIKQSTSLINKKYEKYSNNSKKKAIIIFIPKITLIVT